MATIDELNQRMAQTQSQLADRERQIRTMPTMPQQQPVTGRAPRLTTGQQYQQQIQQDQANRLADQRRRAQQEADALRRQAAQQQAEMESLRSRQSALDLTEGRANTIMDDPYMTGAVKELQGMQGPITDEVRNAMLVQGADMGAQAAQRQSQALREQAARIGTSINDPSYQAMANQIETSRMGQNQALATQSMMDQALQNYAARERALQLMSGIRGQQYGLGNPLASQAAGMYAADVREDPNNPSTYFPIGGGANAQANQTIALLRQIAGR